MSQGGEPVVDVNRKVSDFAPLQDRPRGDPLLGRYATVEPLLYLAFLVEYWVFSLCRACRE